MKDIFENTIICDRCERKTEKQKMVKEGFELRSWVCTSCKNVWYHPADLQEFKNFQELKHKQFQVKLRLVGNSYTVSIPREIIDFQEEFFRDVDTMINMSLENPEKLSLFFRGRLRKLY